MDPNTKRWWHRWSGEVIPHNRHETAEWNRFYAKELGLYFPDGDPHALELGCGNGDLYPYLRDRWSSYVGIDFSSTLLRVFRERWPDARLVYADAAQIPFRARGFDLVFSNGVAQYLSAPVFRQNLHEVARVLRPGGTYLVANIPDSLLKWAYVTGLLNGEADIPATARLRNSLRLIGASVIRGKGVLEGRWFRRGSVRAEAESFGFSCRIFSSSSHEYRFHAVLRLP
jgi:SAM-dependent methyltransferase